MDVTDHRESEAETVDDAKATAAAATSHMWLRGGIGAMRLVLLCLMSISGGHAKPASS